MRNTRSIRNTRIENDISKLKMNIDYDNYQTTVDEIHKLEVLKANDEEGSMVNVISKTVDYIQDMHTC